MRLASCCIACCCSLRCQAMFDPPHTHTPSPPPAASAGRSAPGSAVMPPPARCPSSCASPAAPCWPPAHRAAPIVHRCGPPQAVSRLARRAHLAAAMGAAACHGQGPAARACWLMAALAAALLGPHRPPSSLPLPLPAPPACLAMCCLGRGRQEGPEWQQATSGRAMERQRAQGRSSVCCCARATAAACAPLAQLLARGQHARGARFIGLGVCGVAAAVQPELRQQRRPRTRALWGASSSGQQVAGVRCAACTMRPARCCELPCAGRASDQSRAGRSPLSAQQLHAPHLWVRGERDCCTVEA